MNRKYYTSEINHQILIALMKAHNIRKVIVSPGTTNMCFVGSIQNDPFFEIYSSIDERSASYLACGLAAESGEPVALSCTGATASRNYMSGLTEAFYRKLPVLAITSSQHFGRVGNYIPQVTDRTNPPRDCVKISVQIPILREKEHEDIWAASVKINEALLELRHKGGGPVHINIATEYSRDFNVMELPKVQIINRIEYDDKNFPQINADTVGIFVGAHAKWDLELTSLVDEFCEKYNAAVLCDHTSNYKGKYEIHPNLVPISPRQGMDLLIHIGEVSGAYMNFRPKEVWRVSPDGIIRDIFHKLRYVFEMSESEFFSRYVKLHKGGGAQVQYYSQWCYDYDYSLSKVPELPFSNAWIARKTINKLPENSVLHLGILNSLRCWNFFEGLPKSVNAYSDTGGFGIDGTVSALVGASLADREKLFFGIIGDLAFFYDMNVIGNRHINKNLRLMVISNGCGTEFKLYSSVCTMTLGEDVDKFISARGHFGKQSREVLKHYAQDLGFEYMSASNKDEYLANLDRFTTPEMLDKPIFFEIFTQPEDESQAIWEINNIDVPELLPPLTAVGFAKKTVRKIIGDQNVIAIKKLIGRE